MKRLVKNKKNTISIALIAMSFCLTAQKTYSAVSISEIMFASKEVLGWRPAPQWIELHNAGTDPVNLAGWTLTIQNWDSPDLTGPVNAIITFKDDSDAPQILPNETILLVSATSIRNSGNLLKEQVYSLNLRQQQLDITPWDTILSAEGFHLKLTDSAGNLVDEAGNFDGNILQWQLPLGIIQDRNQARYRISMIRRYVNSVPLDGTQEDSWDPAVNANLPANQLTYYGDKRDISSSGIGPDRIFVVFPVVDCQVGAVLVPGQSCIYPGTDIEFSVLDNGDGRFLDIIFTGINLRDTHINNQFYTLVANKSDDGSWTIEEVGTGISPPVDFPVVDCQVGAVLMPGQSCTYPGTDIEFSALNNGNGRFLDLIFTGINLRDTHINGQLYTLVANKQNDGSWIIEDVATETPSPVNFPVVDCQAGVVLVPGQSCTYPGTDIEFSVLNFGIGRFLPFTATEFNFRDTHINGQPYTFVAGPRSDGSWIIEEVGVVEKPAAVNPRGRKWLLWGQLKANRGLKDSTDYR